MKKISLLLFVMLLSIVLLGCQQSSDVENTSKQQDEEMKNTQKTEGYILKVAESNLLVAQNITAEKYEEIKDQTTIELDEEGISLISVNYDDTASLKVGNKVTISIEAEIQESYPAQADASNIEVLD